MSLSGPSAEPGRTATSWRARLALVLGSVVLALALGEIALRTFGVAPSYSMYGVTLRLDPVLLFRVVPGSSAEINRSGFRDREFDEKGSARRTLMLGDSFVMGLNVPSGSTLPKALERALGPGQEVLNLGVYGYGPDQSFLQLFRDGLALGPDRVILVLFPANDFGDLAKNGLVRLAADGGISFERSNPVSHALRGLRLVMVARYAITGRWLPAAAEDELFRRLFVDVFDYLGDVRDPQTQLKLALMQGLLTRYRSELDARGIAFDVVIIPSYEAVQDPAARSLAPAVRAELLANEKLTVGLCHAARVECLDLSGPFLEAAEAGLYDGADHHLSVAGNLLAARLLAEFVDSAQGSSLRGRASRGLAPQAHPHRAVAADVLFGHERFGTP